MKAQRYLEKMIRFESPSNLSNKEIALYVEMKLQQYQFATERLVYTDANGIPKYSVVGKKGTGRGGLAYFCHSDTVPAPNWFSKSFGPFQPAIARERVYGRGACDMKGSIACMLDAQQSLAPNQLNEPFYFVCTSDEEVGYLGAKQVADESEFYREMVDAQTPGIIGEPTMLEVVYAHKGGCILVATAHGKSGHSSQHGTVNANLAMIPYLNEMKAIFDETESNPKYQNTAFDPPTLSWNIGINDRTHAVNVVPGKSECTVFFRPMPNVAANELIERCRKRAEKLALDFEIRAQKDFLFTDPNSEFVQTSVELARRKRPHTVSYGTDGSVFSELENLIVFGPGSIVQAHTNEEWIALEQLSLGVEMYIRFIRHFCGQ